MKPDEDEIIGEHFRWIRATSEIEDTRDGRRRRESEYDAKVDVYEDRVRFWFLDIAKSHVARGMAPGDYVALLIALAYVEGVEQYRRGKPTPGMQSGEWFKAGVSRIFPDATPDARNRLWSAARNGLFHIGFTKGPTLVSHDQPRAIAIVGRYLKINPAAFVGGVIKDFEAYVRMLRDDPLGGAAAKFTAVWDHQWHAT
jgi:hypothetical protein